MLKSFTIHKTAVIPKYHLSHTTYVIMVQHMYIKQYYSYYLQTELFSFTEKGSII